MHKTSEEALEKLKPEGNLYYYGELEGQEESEAPLNPISLILFTQMVVKSWHNYALKGKKDIKESKKKKERRDPYDSLNDSCDSDIEEARYEKINEYKRGANRRGGLIESKMKE